MKKLYLLLILFAVLVLSYFFNPLCRFNRIGENYKAADGCNSCVCGPLGGRCSLMACDNLGSLVEEHSELTEMECTPFNESFVIRTEEEYNALLDYRECANMTLPEIEFSEHMLLGKFTAVTGCSANVERRVVKDRNGLTYVIQISETPECESGFTTGNWILVPQSNKSVNFVVKKV